ncbi:hypothetical protein NLJ89_g9391 [Agrocybe chaxingu]|uniref:Uncharacterized protein n=1 Tax=Agrocybe chaxingu TaxID=84603 RepID=A0A9W8JST7_9AGAR|nr:hypothetical protein NLJ89_g9391 [Agrocybe chaxingu]
MAFGVNIVPLTRPPLPRVVPQPDYASCGVKLCCSSPRKDPETSLATLIKEYFTAERYHRRMSLADEFAAFARAYPYALPKCPEPEPVPMNDPTLFQFDDFMDVCPIDSPLQYDPQPIYSFMEFLRTANSEFYEPTLSTDDASVPVTQPQLQPTPEDPVLDADFWNSLMDADPSLFEPSAVEDLLRKSFEDFGQDFWGMPYEEFKAKMEESQAQLECSWLPPDITLPSE